MRDALKERKLRKKTEKLTVEEFKKEIIQANNSGDTEKVRDLAYHYTYKLQQEEKNNIYSTLGEDIINIIAQKLPISSLVHLHEYMSTTDDGKKIFQKFVDTK